MNQFFQSAFSEALGWSLVDSLWQTGILWLLYVLLTANGKWYSSTVRHNLAFFSLMAGTAWFFISLLINYNDAINNPGRTGLLYSGVINDIINSSISAASFAYLIVVTLYAARFFAILGKSRSLNHGTLIAPSSEIIATLQRLCEKIKVDAAVRLWFSENIQTPVTSGRLRPVILFPLSVITHLNTHQLEAVIAHELFHIRRNDYFRNLLIMFAEVILFFNPFARIFATLVKKERENCCDDGVLSLGYHPWEYAQALYVLGKNQSTLSRQYALAAIGTEKKFLLLRIKRLLQIQTSDPSFIKPLLTFFLCLFAAIFASDTPVTPTSSADAQAVVQVKNPVVLEKPVIVHFEEKKEIRQKQLRKPSLAKRENRKPASGKKVQKEVAEPAPHSITIASDDNVIIHLVDDEQVVDFSFMEPAPVEPPQPSQVERPLPYVPGSTFFSTPGTSKKRVLKIIVL